MKMKKKKKKRKKNILNFFFYYRYSFQIFTVKSLIFADHEYITFIFICIK